MSHAKSNPHQVSTIPRTQHARARNTGTRKYSHAELAHKLEVHQVELEMQNEELRHAQMALAIAHDRYADLYDFAPIGYFTLDAQGIVTAVNLTGARMLGAARNTLLGRSLSHFIVPSHVDAWYRHIRQALYVDGPGRIELELRSASGEKFHAQLDSTSTQSTGAEQALSVTLTDITIRKLAEIDRRIAGTVHDAREVYRRQVARQLHEGLGQLLSALKMELGSLIQPVEPALQGERVRAMLGTLDIALESVRRITADLRPPMLDDLGLGAAIEWLAHDCGRRLGLDIELDLSDPQTVPDERTSTAIYRMAQEIVDDLAGREDVASIALGLSQQGPELVFAVRYRCKHDRVGADCLSSKETVRSLMDRAHLLGGQVEFADRAGRQPKITVRLPLSRKENP